MDDELSIGDRFRNKIIFGRPAAQPSRYEPDELAVEPASPAEYSTRKPASALPETLQEQLTRQHADDSGKQNEVPLPLGELEDPLSLTTRRNSSAL